MHWTVGNGEKVRRKIFRARVNKGKRISRKLLSILEGIPFGRLYYQVAVLLRNSLLVSSPLSNSEAWFGLTDKSVDLAFLRSISMPPKSIPKKILIGLGLVPGKADH